MYEQVQLISTGYFYSVAPAFDCVQMALGCGAWQDRDLPRREPGLAQHDLDRADQRLVHADLEKHGARGFGPLESTH